MEKLEETVKEMRLKRDVQVGKVEGLSSLLVEDNEQLIRSLGKTKQSNEKIEILNEYIDAKFNSIE